MKIVYTSDIHVDISNNNLKMVDYLTEYLKSSRPELFIIAGDIANTCDDISNTLDKFKSIDCVKVFVPGNHDLWIQSKTKLKKGFDSSFKYEVELGEICQHYGFVYPIYEPLIYNDLAIIGTVGWYDYSLRDERLDSMYFSDDYDNGVFDNLYWSDFSAAVWLTDRTNESWRIRSKKMKTADIFQKVFTIFKNSFNKIPQNIQQVIVVMHTVPYKDCIIRKDIPDPFDAYEGSLEYGKFFDEIGLQKMTILCGHNHRKLDMYCNKGVRVLRAPIGYLDYDVDDFDKVLSEKIGVMYV